jgi:hypothetical protein
MEAKEVWFGNTAWPSGASPGAFAKDIFKLENCQTDKFKALSFAKWLLRCLNRGPNLFLPGMGGYLKSNDPTILFTSWGHNECTGWGWVATEALNAAGLKTRRAVAFNHGHTFYEVWYIGDNNKEGWHAFDPFNGWFYTNDEGEVASCEELNKNPDLVLHPRLGSASPLGNHPEKCTILHRYQTSDLIDIVQDIKDEEISFNPKIGQTYTVLWRPELPNLAIPCGDKDTDGAHCSIDLYNESGMIRHPDHFYYWKNYVWPTPNSINRANGGQSVRWHGSGALRWQPLLFGDKVIHKAHNAIFENGTVRPRANKAHCEVWWKIQIPYLASYLRLGIAVDIGGGDMLGISVSPDNGQTLHNLFWGGNHPPKVIELNPHSVPSIKGLREFLVRIDMSSQSPTSNLRVRGFQINVGYQLNMNILPRLVPGNNELFIKAKSVSSDIHLVADWAYTHPEGEIVDTVALNKSGINAINKKLDIKLPSDIIMRGVTLKCLPR